MGTERRIIASARLVGSSSLMARETCDTPGVVFEGNRPLTFGEAQNKAGDRLERRLMTDPQHARDDVLANILREQFEILGADPQALVATIEVSQSRTSEPRYAAGSASARVPRRADTLGTDPVPP